MVRAFSGLLGVDDSEQLQSAIDGLGKADFITDGRILSASGQQLTSAWSEEITKRPGSSTTQREVITAGATAVAHKLGIQVKTGGVGKLGFLTRPFEFGSLSRDEYTTYDRHNRKGNGSHKVKRRASRQMPTRSQTGWIAYPAAKAFTTRAVHMFQQVVVKTMHDAIEGKL
ncbi:hypothetical protein [Glaciibacter flavus]|uniref:hypothetical protein n=1 Tax=Orlajensenia flava TaxID=2565934 RepID=UPI003AFF6758